MHLQALLTRSYTVDLTIKKTVPDNGTLFNTRYAITVGYLVF